MRLSEHAREHDAPTGKSNMCSSERGVRENALAGRDMRENACNERDVRERETSKTYADRIIARARELSRSDAFAPAVRDDLMPAGRESETTAQAGDSSTACVASIEQAATARAAIESANASNKRSRTWILVFALISVVIAGFSLLLPYAGIDAKGDAGTVYSPADVIDCYALWFKANVMPLFDATLANRTTAMIDEFAVAHGSAMYTAVTNRALVTVIVAACGIMLAASGLLFQTSFRNPLATPSILGVTDGVTLGCIIFTMSGYASIGENPALYLLLVYGLGAAMVVVVLFFSRAMSGGARYNVLDMLLLGTVICQLLSGINGFVQNFVMDSNSWYNFYDVQQAADALIDSRIQITFAVVFLLTFIPALILRFKLNMVAFSNDEAEMMGVRATLLRAGALILGSAMQLCAIATIGQVAMLSLAVPFLVRFMMPADFRGQFLGNCLVGIAVLLACVVIQHFVNIGAAIMPVGTIVSIFIVPFFIWMVALGRSRW